jgi:hypothetical protein
MTKVKPWGGVRDWAKLQESAKAGFTDGVQLLEMYDFIERGNEPKVLKGLQRMRASGAGLVIRRACLAHMIMLVTRAFGPVGRKDDLHLRAAVEFIRHKTPAALTSQPEQQRHLQDVVVLFDREASDAGLALLDHMRHKEIAHWADYGAKSKPTYHHLFNLARAAASIWERLAWGTGILGLTMTNQTQASKDQGKNFWARWET